MKKNYFIQINEKGRSIMLQPCNAFEAIRLLNFYRGGMNLLKYTQEVTSVELDKIGEPLPKRIFLVLILLNISPVLVSTSTLIGVVLAIGKTKDDKSVK